LKIGIYANIEKPKVVDLLPDLFLWLEEHEIETVISHNLTDQYNSNFEYIEMASIEQLPRLSDIIITLGGDGTILSAARLIGDAGKPILGINLGGLGFLTEVSIDGIYAAIERVLQHDYVIEKRMVLAAVLFGNGENQHFFGLNDIVVFRGDTVRLLYLKVYIDDEYFNTYESDGLIMSTPTGSTAYSLSSGGPIVVPGLNSIILNPICPHALTVRPTVISSHSRIRLEIQESLHPVQLTADGQVTAETNSCTSIEIQRADFDIGLIKFSESTFFDRLREKLQWGSLPYK